MERNEGIKKYFLKNNYNLAFSILALIVLIFLILNATKVDVKISILNQIIGVFSLSTWILLLLSLIVSSALAYFGKYKWIVLPVFIWLLIFSVQFRTVNLPQLIDVTTGESTMGPDLDPYLYLRLAEEINAGNSSDLDCMRYAPTCSNNYAYSNLMPWAILGVYKLGLLFKEISITDAANITAVIFFFISIIGFFLFTWLIFSFKLDKIKSSLVALIASIFYVFSPSMIHRTTGGIPEIESLGLAFFWFAFLFFALAWKSENKKKWVVFGIIAAIFTELMSFSWGGYRFIYLILSLTTFVIFFLEKDIRKNIIIFSSWFIPGIIIEMIKSKSLTSVVSSFSGPGFGVLVFLLLILQVIFLKFKLQNKFSKIKLSNPIKIMILAAIIGLLGLLILNPELILKLISEVINGLLYPFGKARVSLTVAENAAPYLADAIAQFGYIIWAFLISTFILFYDSTRAFNKKDRIKLSLAFIVFISCIFFNRISSSSILNGENFLSHLIFFAGFAVFIITAISIERKSPGKEHFKEIDISYIMLLAFSFWAIVSMRGAVRLLFIVSPMMILVASVLPIRLYDLIKRTRDELLKLIVIILLVVTILVFAHSCIIYSSSAIYQAAATAPGAYEQQWQGAMAWVRENTNPNSIFVHWWDYGYWVQTIGKRPTVTDGGHFTSYWDHLIGRYVLTNPFPEAALSFMKTHEVSYLLIDSTDLGKYSAYSSIGSDNTGQDRYSWMPVMTSSSSQIQETKNGTIRIYNGGFGIDEDIIYEKDGKKILLPSSKTPLAGVILEYQNETIKQPESVFIYNGNQLNIPVRYAYYNQKFYDFEEGLNATVMIIPSLNVNSKGGAEIDEQGAMIYLSDKTRNSLFAKLYLMNDPLNEYPTLNISHIEYDSVIKYLNSQGENLEFIYYGGFRGPIKIWKVEYPENIVTEEGFLKLSGDYAEFDNLSFTK